MKSEFDDLSANIAADITKAILSSGIRIVRNHSRKFARFDVCADIGSPDAKSYDTIVKDGRILDYRNVKIGGYLSTFKSTTPSDRDGDYVEPGAFQAGIDQFRKNPVLLANHNNNVSNIVGTFTNVYEDNKGLYVEATLSNSPGDLTTHTRAVVAEGHLRTLSMGGIFHYAQDGRGIFKVDLWEGSLVAIPANPDATFSVREISAEEVKALWMLKAAA